MRLPALTRFIATGTERVALFARSVSSRKLGVNGSATNHDRLGEPSGQAFQAHWRLVATCRQQRLLSGLTRDPHIGV